MHRIKGFLALLAASFLIATACRSSSAQKDLNPGSLPPEDPSSAALSSQAEVPPPYSEYNITLTLDPESRRIEAIETVKYVNDTDMVLDKIYFNVYANAFSQESGLKPYLPEHERKIFQNGLDYGWINISDVYRYDARQDFELTGTTLQIELADSLRQGELLEITLAFEAYVPKISHRTGAGGDSLWLGNFIPTLAVYDEYGWHRGAYYPVGDSSYTDIANFTATINTPAGYTTVVPGIETSKTTDNKTTTVTTTKLIRNFAFYVTKSDRVVRDTTASGVDIAMYLRQGSGIREINLQTAARALDYFSRIVGSYPYEKLDLVECDLYDQVCVAYPEMVFMDSECMESADAVQNLVHAIGHQWFYNIVGNNPVKEAWLSEGLVSCLTEILLYENEDALYQKMRADYQDLKDRLKTMEEKTLLQDLSVYASYDDYYNIQYTRSKLMFYALRRKMGIERFEEFLKTYFDRYSFRNVSRYNFMDTVEEVYGDSLTDFFDAWMQNYDLPPL